MQDELSRVLRQMDDLLCRIDQDAGRCRFLQRVGVDFPSGVRPPDPARNRLIGTGWADRCQLVGKLRQFLPHLANWRIDTRLRVDGDEVIHLGISRFGRSEKQKTIRIHAVVEKAQQLLLQGPIKIDQRGCGR